MKKYKIYGIVTATKYIGEVEAESEQEAEDKGWDLDGCFAGSLCYHCAKEYDLDDMSELIVEEVPDKKD